MALKTHVQNGIDPDPHVFGVLAPHAHWLLRFALASVFLFHGLQKFLVIGLDGFAAMMNLPLSAAFLVASAEVLGGAGILAGATLGGRLGDLATRLSGVAIVPVMLGAIAMVHWGRWSFTAAQSHPLGGMEFQVVLLLLALYFAICGNDA